MKTIWQFQLPVRESVKVEMPFGARVLSVQLQGRLPCIWARVDTDEKRRCMYRFKWRGTGHDLGDVVESWYIGTVQQDGFVWHLYADDADPPLAEWKVEDTRRALRRNLTTRAAPPAEVQSEPTPVTPASGNPVSAPLGDKGTCGNDSAGGLPCELPVTGHPPNYHQDVRGDRWPGRSPGTREGT